MTHSEALDKALQSLGAITGSIHRVRGNYLQLCAERGLPPEILKHIERIPKGKGMAGQAWLTKSPVSTCNIGTDETGLVKDRAKKVDAGAALAVPVLNSNGQVKAVVGFAYKGGEVIGDERLSECIDAARIAVEESERT